MTTYRNQFLNPRCNPTGDISTLVANSSTLDSIDTLSGGSVPLLTTPDGTVSSAMVQSLNSNRSIYAGWSFTPAVVGQYVFSCYYWRPAESGLNAMRLNVTFWNDPSIYTPEFVLGKDIWERLTYTFNVSADSVGNPVSLYWDSDSNAGLIYLTGWQVTTIGEDHAFFDGTYSGASWEGTPNASISSLTAADPTTTASVPYRGSERLTLHPLEETRGKVIASPLQLTNDNPWWGIRTKKFTANSPPLRQQLLARGDIPGSQPVYTSYDNREIGMQVRALPADIGATDVTNLWPNPKGAYGTAGLTLAPTTTYVPTILCEDEHKDSFITGAVPDAQYPAAGIRPVTLAGAESCFAYQGAVGEQMHAEVDLVAGEEYTYSCYVTQPKGAETGSPVHIFVETGAGVENVGFYAIPPTGDAWVRVSITFTSTLPGIHRLGVKRTTGTALPWFFTGFSLTKSASLLPYIDGDTPGARWEGPVHNSTSTLPADVSVRLNNLLADLQMACSYAQSGKPGSVLRQVLPSGRRIYFDLVSAELQPQMELLFLRGHGDEIELKFSAQPFARGRRTYPNTTPGPLQDNATRVLMISGVEGDAPAPARISVVTDAATVDNQQAILWASDSRANPDAGSTDSLFLPGNQLVPVSPFLAANTAGENSLPAGASYGITGMAKNAPGYWQPIAQMQLSTFDPLTHVGRFRVFARMNFSFFTNGFATGIVRLVWRVGVSGVYAENRAVRWTDNQPLDSNGWWLVDLGIIEIPKSPIGVQSWDGQIQVQYNGFPSAVEWRYSLNSVTLLPTESSGRATALPASPVPQNLIALDSLQYTGNTLLNGRAQMVGGNWASSGSATDFLVSGIGAARSTSVDEPTGRVAISATPSGVSWASVELSTSGSIKGGLFHRYTTSFATSWRAEIDNSAAFALPGQARLTVYVDDIPVYIANALDLTLGIFYTLAAFVDKQGRWGVYWARAGFPLGIPVARGQRSILSQFPTPQARASGSSGIFDKGTTVAGGRTYRNWRVYSSFSEFAVYANGGEARIGKDGAYRHGEGPLGQGTNWAKIAKYEGDLPRLPAGNRAKNTTRLIVRSCRNDPLYHPDYQDEVGVTVSYLPQYLHVPNA